MALQYYLEQLNRMLPQAYDELPAGSLEERLGDAVREFSRFVPRLRAKDYSGDGSTYTLDLPNDWDERFSRIVSIESPQGEQEPTYLDPWEYTVYLTPDGYQLRLFSTPSDTTTVRVAYTALHRVNSQDDTVPEAHKRALCYLAASMAARNLAAKYAGFTDPSITADAIGYTTKQREYNSQADFYMNLFKLHLAMKPGDLAPAAASWGQLQFDIIERQGVEP